MIATSKAVPASLLLALVYVHILIGALDTNYELIIESSKELKKDDRYH